MAAARLSGGGVVTAIKTDCVSSAPPLAGGEAANRPTVEKVCQWLEDVPDPEIPVVSVVELGIVRDVKWRGDTLVVTVTPTYSGCPATAVIAFEVEETIRRKGVDAVRIETRISPAWTTDWITDAAREKLKAYGIAPPSPENGGAACAGMLKAPAEVACPQCDSIDTVEISRFGSTPCKASWRCDACLEPFDYFKSF